jgi:adenylate kinase family enzyme
VLIVVTGPPAAGKSTWIKAQAKPTDIVIDFDRIAVSIAGPGADTHHHSDAAAAIAHRMRYAAIEESIRHLDKTDVYLIHTQPSAKALARYRRLNARVVEIDPGKDVVMQRVAAMRRPGMTGVVTRWYASRGERSSATQRVGSQSSRVW